MPSNVTGLPTEFIKRFKDALAAVCETRDERRLLLAEAFGTGPTSDAIRSIDRDLTAPLFAVDCCVKLSSEPVADGTHPLAAILRVVGERRGAEAVRELGALIEFCNGLRPSPAAADLPSPRSVLEREYLERLRLEDLIITDKYTRLAGVTRLRSSSAPNIRGVVARPEFEHLAHRVRGVELGPPRRFEDVVPAVLAIQRAAVLGEPGAGKTTVLWKIAREMVDAALNDRSKPIPLLVKLGFWTKPDEPLQAFIAGQLGGLGTHLDALLAEEKAALVQYELDGIPVAQRKYKVALLLDGLNEIPVTQRKDKVAQLRTYLHTKPQCDFIAIVTCREQDYMSAELNLDRITILPFDAIRIRSFCISYLGVELGIDLFDKLIGADWRHYESWFRDSATNIDPNWELAFWTKDSNSKWEWDSAMFAKWRAVRDNPRSLLQLAKNPYLLFMLTQVYSLYGSLPQNRAHVFEQFVEVLLLRENLAARNKNTGAIALSESAVKLLDGLSGLAYAMQGSLKLTGNRTTVERNGTPATSIGLSEARRHLDDTELDLAANASLIRLGDEVVFTHQLLQEYFAARKMLEEIKAGRLDATKLWPPVSWWDRNGWEEATVFLTGMEADDGALVLRRWLADVNPEVTAACIRENGASSFDDAMLLELRARWVPRLTDLKRDPDPRARAAVGRALGLLTLNNGETLDNRPGVRAILGADRDHVPTPEIDWVSIEGGDFIYQKEIRKIESFRIARYPVTYAQFEAFVDASDGWSYQRRWKSLSASKTHREQPDAQWFKYWNHPRDDVSWFDAVAFCDWLSARLGFEVRLPSEYEWERAARGKKGRTYAHIGRHDPAKANTQKSIGSTSAVGIYPNGATPRPEGVLDLTGNVWEWCLNEYGNPDRTALSGDSPRALRGGAWYLWPGGPRASHRIWFFPNYRHNTIGFRVVSAPVQTR